MLLKTFKILVSIALIIGLGHLYYQYTGNFRTDDILRADDQLLSFPELDKSEAEDIQRRMDQTFHYVGHGHQTYVFIGDDGETMLKLFMKNYVRSDWVRYLFPPLPPLRKWMLHTGENHRFRQQRLLNGYALCYARDKDNCGLLYFHFDQAAPISSIRVVDALGFTHDIPSDQAVFALQRKAVITKEVLHDLLSKGDTEGVREAVHKILSLYREQFEKGLVDRDRNFLENTGFVDGRPIRTDVGKVVLNDGSYTLEYEYGKIIDKRLSKWIKKHFPDLKEILLNS